MRIHYLQHVPFEGAANIAVWAAQNGHSLSCTKLYESAKLPPVAVIDWLVIMGGPMNIYEEDAYPWLAAEKVYIRRAIDAGKRVLGVCLGGQLICAALGGQVTRNGHKEIGWFECALTPEAHKESLLSDLPSPFMAFHWHGDTFSIPPGAVRLAGSEACANQAFQFGRRVLGMQFHFDYAPADIQTMVTCCEDELGEGPYIQKPAELANLFNAGIIQSQLYRVLDRMADA